MVNLLQICTALNSYILCNHTTFCIKVHYFLYFMQFFHLKLTYLKLTSIIYTNDNIITFFKTDRRNYLLNSWDVVLAYI